MQGGLPRVAPVVRGGCDGPLDPHVGTFAAELATSGYADHTMRTKLSLVADFGRWLSERQIVLADLDDRIAGKFIDELRGRHRLRRGHRRTVQSLLDHLRSEKAIRAIAQNCEPSPLTALEQRYASYLRVERGLTAAAVAGYQPLVHRFLVERFGDGHVCPRDLAPPDISRFILRQARSMSRSRAKLMVTALRSFFRFLMQHGEIDANLAASVPTVANWRLTSIPKYLTPEEVERLIAGCDRRTPTGRRDRAVLILLARLGLRASEIVKLELDDIDWRAGEIAVSGKGLLRDRLPLLPDIGEAMVAYLRLDRPESQSRRVFIRMRAPRGGFANPTTVCTIVRRALERAGLDPPIKGAHLLRHSLATRMVRAGASLAEIGEVLRHRAIGSTEIYAKVDSAGLRTLALPWPIASGGAR